MSYFASFWITDNRSYHVHVNKMYMKECNTVKLDILAEIKFSDFDIQAC